eukprot:g388.t1
MRWWKCGRKSHTWTPFDLQKTASKTRTSITQGTTTPTNIEGPNGSGKSRLCRSLYRHVRKTSKKGGSNISNLTNGRSKIVEYLSMDSEAEFLHECRDKIARVSDVLGGLKANEDLIVRFGLVNLWYRPITCLSTGELRKLSLARAMSSRPELLILDQPYDGLDAETRPILRALIEEVSEGFAPLLVGTHTARSCCGSNIGDGKSSGSSHLGDDRSQVILATNRPQEESVRVCDARTIRLTSSSALSSSSCDDDHGTSCVDAGIEALVGRANDKGGECGNVAIEVDNIRVVASDNEGTSDDDVVLLDNVGWTARRGESWIVSGPNGSGKSSLMRVLLGCVGGSDAATDDEHVSITEGTARCVGRVALVSPGSCITADVDNDETVLRFVAAMSSEVVEDAVGACDSETFSIVLDLLGLSSATLATRRVRQLSQGERQMVLFARALATRPTVLISDEGFHGLDSSNRARVREVLDKLARSRATTVVTISHHQDEWPRSTSRRLELNAGRVVSCGSVGGTDAGYPGLSRHMSL